MSVLRRAAAPVLVGALALAAIVVAVWRLESAARGIAITAERVGEVPITVFRSTSASRDPPVVVIAHGFAGSQQLMHPLAVTLARNGYVAVTFDFPGHGRSPEPMPGGVSHYERAERSLLVALAAVGELARARLSPDGRYAVLGHSMASDLIVRHAQAHPAVHATIAVSAFAPTVREDTPPDQPRNLLVVVGALEPQALRDEALRIVRAAADGTPQPGVDYGRFDKGTARRAAWAHGAEHIGVLYAADTLRETLAWLDRAFDRPPAAAPFLDTRGLALALLLAGVLALAWPLSRLLPRVGHHPPPGLTRRGFWLAATIPAIVTPLVLWPVPTGFLPILLADYLVLHFALYGLLTFAVLRALPRMAPAQELPVPSAGIGVLALAAVATAGYALLAVGVPIDRYVFNLQPAPGRWPYVLAMCVGTATYFFADERLVRAAGAPRFAYAATKALFLVSLALAIALNLRELFFLIIIVPAILLLFVVYGAFSTWAWRSARHYAVPAAANALAFAWFVAVTFPRVG